MNERILLSDSSAKSYEEKTPQSGALPEHNHCSLRHFSFLLPTAYSFLAPDTVLHACEVPEHHAQAYERIVGLDAIDQPISADGGL